MGKENKRRRFLSFKDLYVSDLQTTTAGGYIMTGSFNDNRRIAAQCKFGGSFSMVIFVW